MIGSASAFAAGTFGFTPTATELIGVGAGAFLLGLIDFIRSQIGRKLNLPLKPLQKIQEEAEAEEYENHPRPTLFGPNSFRKPFIDDNPTLTGITPLKMQDAATARAINEVKTKRAAIAPADPQFTVRHKSAKKGSRWNVHKFHDKEIALARFETLSATQKDGWVEITGPGIEP